ncbi:MAG: ATP-binding protein [Sciscionella sp.]
MSARAWTATLSGVDGVVVEIEADTSAELPGALPRDMPGPEWREVTERVRAALRHSYESWPARHVALAVSPAVGVPASPGGDLAFAAAVLAADGRVPQDSLGDTVLLGALAPDGRVCGVRGVLPALLVAHRAGFERAIVPAQMLAEAALVPGVEVLGATDLAAVLGWLRGHADSLRRAPYPVAAPNTRQPDLTEVTGRPHARWALEVAAAGGHSLAFIGRPGSGTTLLAAQLPGLLPPLSPDEAMQVTAIHSAAGLLTPDAPRIETRPFVAPHHTCSLAALIGGGRGVPRPGVLSRAHHGVLLMDSVAEFGPQRLSAVRAALDTGQVCLAGRHGSTRFPAGCHLIAAATPCPCAAPVERDCTCRPRAVDRYRERLGTALLDRVDLHVPLPPAARGARVEQEPHSTATVAARVDAARQRAAHRWAHCGARSNAEAPGSVLWRSALPPAVTEPLQAALRRGSISSRAAEQTLRIAWTLADLSHDERPHAEHAAAARALRRGLHPGESG